MGKSPLILAALAKAAVSGLDIKTVRRLNGAQTGMFDSAVITCTDGSEYVIRIPESTSGALELDVETAVLKSLNSATRARLPFAVTRIQGETSDSNRRRVVVFDYLYGSEVNLSRMMANSPSLASIGLAIAAIHSLDPEIVRSSGLPEYSASEVAKRRMTELDNAAMTGLVPKVLLERWQDALEDVSFFQYTPTVVHGEMAEANVLEQDQSVSAVLNWGALHIGDPADDFSWIAGKRNFDLLDAARIAYSQGTKVFDSTLTQRAVLYSELSHARWLLHGTQQKDQEIIDEACAELEILAGELADGLLPSLGAVSFATLSNTEGSFVSDSFVAETLVESLDSTGSIETIQDVVFVANSGDLAESEAQPEVQGEYQDDKTREIELPEKTDNELF
jgi:aminoglycoside phosphotransferase (APT) family kinase protein